MKVKEIEFGVTVNLGDYQSSKLSLKAELEDGEDYMEALASLQKEVIELSGARPWLLKNLPTYKNNQEVLKTLEEAQECYQNKREQLDELMHQLRKLEPRLSEAERLIVEFNNFDSHETTISNLSDLVQKFEKLKKYQEKLQKRETEEANNDPNDPIMF
ncbi:MAG: hypothetical protein VKK42_07780 [Lyngbya sp.]|nr:hypothetical protein [Lyngbya sp.]